MTLDRWNVEEFIEDPKTKLAKSHKPSFSAGFAKGFGAVSCVLSHECSDRSNAFHISGWSRKSHTDQILSLKRAKLKIISRYVGRTAAKKLCTIPTTMPSVRPSRCDALMLHDDWSKAVCKLHG